MIIFTTDLTDWTDRVLQGVRQKPEKPLGEDGGCCPLTHGSALQAPERIQVLIFTTDLTDETDSCLVAIK